MIPSDVTRGVTAAGGVLLAAVAAASLAVAGTDGALGVLAGGGLGLLNFRWLASTALTATRPGREGGSRWLPWAGLRFAVLAAAAGGLLEVGGVSAVGLVAGLTVVPCALVVAGLAAARHAAGR
jgi:hypothetical protein